MEVIMITINIKKDFSDMPGGRYEKEGPYSGEEFRKKILLPKYNEAEQTNQELQINFDDCYGFATSFLEEAFGGMVREHNKKGILSRIKIISNDDETIQDLIEKYVKAAEKEIR